MYLCEVMWLLNKKLFVWFDIFLENKILFEAEKEMSIRQIILILVLQIVFCKIFLHYFCVMFSMYILYMSWNIYIYIYILVLDTRCYFIHLSGTAVWFFNSNFLNLYNVFFPKRFKDKIYNVHKNWNGYSSRKLQFFAKAFSLEYCRFD